MFLDARSLPNDTAIDTDLCIVGAGAAGITIARELAGQPYRIVLLESGGLEIDAPTQALYEGAVVGRAYDRLDAVRLRYFGGATNHWDGNAWPLSPIDFEPRPWIPHSGWPFDYTALEPYYRRAQILCELGPDGFDPATWSPRRTAAPPFEPAAFEQRISQTSPPTRFGERYRRDIETAANIDTYLHANATEFVRTAVRISEARCATLAGNEFKVTARAFVLACGGLENPRLLLSSTGRDYPAGLGNRHDRVGRFFMDHFHAVAGVALLNDRSMVDFYSETETEPPSRGFTALSDAAQAQHETTNLQLRVARGSPSGGVAALRGIARDARAGRWPDQFGERLAEVLGDVDDVARELGHRAGLGAVPRTIIAVTEQTPNPNSRVSLGIDRDALGMRRLQLDWRHSAIDKRSVRVALELFGRELGRLGLGRVRIDLDADDSAWTEPGWPGPHHMGTTRMHDDPRQGVVDRHGRVHETENLYVAGSSVFPTSGSSHPTLTIVALSLRLADHLNGVLRV